MTVKVGEHPIIILLLDDYNPADGESLRLKTRREGIAAIIEKAAHDGARAVVFDTTSAEPGPSDNAIKNALQQSAAKKIPIFMVEDQRISLFRNEAVVGHVIAQVSIEQQSQFREQNLPAFNGFFTEANFGGFIIDRHNLYALPALAAYQTSICAGREKKELDDLPPHIRFRDSENPKSIEAKSYLEYASVEMKGALVFIGTSVDSSSGEPVNLTIPVADPISHSFPNRTSERMPGIYKLVSATIGYSQLLCQTHEKLIEQLQDAVRDYSFFCLREACKTKTASARDRLLHLMREVEKKNITLPGKLADRISLILTLENTAIQNKKRDKSAKPNSLGKKSKL